jgi:hypothetical protein
VDSDGVIYVCWSPGLRIELEDARAAIEAVDKLSHGSRRPMFIDMTGRHSLSRQARIAFAAPAAASRIALRGSSPVDRMIVNFCLQRNPTPCPTRFFTSTKKALA